MPDASDKEPLYDLPFELDAPAESASLERLDAEVVEAPNGLTENLQDPECRVSNRNVCVV